jgi:hypothetical protein
MLHNLTFRGFITSAALMFVTSASVYAQNTETLCRLELHGGSIEPPVTVRHTELPIALTVDTHPERNGWVDIQAETAEAFYVRIETVHGGLGRSYQGITSSAKLFTPEVKYKVYPYRILGQSEGRLLVSTQWTGVASWTFGVDTRKSRNTDVEGVGAPLYPLYLTAPGLSTEGKNIFRIRHQNLGLPYPSNEQYTMYVVDSGYPGSARYQCALTGLKDNSLVRIVGGKGMEPQKLLLVHVSATTVMDDGSTAGSAYTSHVIRKEVWRE